MPSSRKSCTLLLTYLLFALTSLLSACPGGGSGSLPSDGRQVQIENDWGGSGFKIKDNGVLLLKIPGRKVDGKDVLPQKAVVHKDTLYVLWQDDHTDTYEKPR